MTQRIGRPPHPDVLTPAEWRVLDEIRAGHPNAEIAVRLGISVNTVKYHVSNMLAKLEVPDRHALAAWDGQPRRRFGFLPSLPPIALGVSFARGSAIAGSVAAAAAAVFAIVLLTSSGPAEARTDVILRLGSGIDSTQLVAVDPQTGEPLVHADALDLSDRIARPLAPDGSLFWLARPPWIRTPPGANWVITVLDGEALGLPSSGHRTDRDGVVRSWTIPPTDEFSYLGILAPPTSASDRRYYVTRTPVGDAPTELWAFTLDSDQGELLTSRTGLVDLTRTSDGRLFAVERSQPLPVEFVDGTQVDGFTEQVERYLATARDVVIELDPDDGDELARFEIDGPVARTFFSGDERHLYVLTPRDGDVTLINLDTMRSERRSLPVGGPWPGVGSLGAFVSTSLSPDGTLIYFVGTDHVVSCPGGESAEIWCRPTAVGIRIVDLESNAVVYEDPYANQLALSPDGRNMLTANHHLDAYRDDPDQLVTLIDTASFATLGVIETDADFRSFGFASDGLHAYALADGGGPLIPTCSSACGSVSVIDLDRLEVIATHTYDEPLLALTTLR